MISLDQRRLLIRRRTTLNEVGVNTSVADLFQPEQERVILYEELVLDRASRRFKYDGLLLWTGLGIAILAGAMSLNLLREFDWVVLVVSVGGCLVGALMMIAGWFRSVRIVHIPVHHGPDLELLADVPSEANVSAFISELRTTAKQYVLKKFGPIPGLESHEASVNRVRWLRDRNFITDDEMNGFLSKLPAARYGEGSGSIGFKG